MIAIVSMRMNMPTPAVIFRTPFKPDLSLLVTLAADRHQEAVAAPGQRLDKAGVIGGVAEGFSQFVDRCIQPIVEIDEGILRPQLGAQLFTTDQFTRTLQQEREHLKRLFLQLDPLTLLPQLTAAHIHLKRCKAKDGWRTRFRGHVTSPSAMPAV